MLDDTPIVNALVFRPLIGDVGEGESPDIILGVDSDILNVRNAPRTNQVRCLLTGGNLIPLELNLLEVVGALVSMLVLEPEYNALAVLCICPGKARSIIVKEILELPGSQIGNGAFCGVVAVALMQACPSVLVQRTGIVSGNDDVIGVRDRLRLRIICYCANVVGDPVLHTGDKLSGISERHKLLIGNGDHGTAATGRTLVLSNVIQEVFFPGTSLKILVIRITSHLGEHLLRSGARFQGLSHSILDIGSFVSSRLTGIRIGALIVTAGFFFNVIDSVLYSFGGEIRFEILEKHTVTLLLHRICLNNGCNPSVDWHLGRVSN